MAEIVIRYLHQSGFELTVRSGGRSWYLLFDDDGRGPAPDEALLSGADTAAAFVSHRHGDHFSPRVFALKRSCPALELILSDDLRPRLTPEERRLAQLVAPGARLERPGLSVRTLRSTDEGVAFLVRLGRIAVYHAGDLNWWHWEGEPEEWNRRMADSYRAEIHRLRGERVDLAFLPVDGRLGQAATLGADLFMERVGAGAMVPMHFWDDPAVLDRLREKPYAGRVCALTAPGETARLTL